MWLYRLDLIKNTKPLYVLHNAYVIDYSKIYHLGTGWDKSAFEIFLLKQSNKHSSISVL